MDLTSTILDLLNKSNPSAPFHDLKAEAEDTADLVTVLASSIATATIALRAIRRLEDQRQRSQELATRRKRQARQQVTRQRQRRRMAGGFYS